MAKYVYWLKEIYQSDRAVAGGKGANLGDLARGLTVPQGFCLASTAYYDNLMEFGLHSEIAGKLAGTDTGSITELERVSAEITALIMKTPLLPEIDAAVTSAFTEMAGDNPGLKVAVRSSATAEDLVDASFAGLQETFLNVEELENVKEAVKKCWASLWTARAIHYRVQKGFAHELVRMAVIIQEMVPATVSGVMFTANPVNNNRNEMRIEAVRGLGEQLVSGEAAGDVYILSKSESNVDIVTKSISDPGQGQMLNDYELRELGHTGLKIEIFYEGYQDIEWAYHRGKFYFLQTRPVTTLADEELPRIDLKKMNRLRREVMQWVAERFPDPIHPIDGIIVKVLFMAQFEAMQGYGYKIGDVDWTKVEKGIFPEFFTPPRIRPGLKRLWRYLRLGKTLRSDPAAEWASEQKYLLDMLKRLKARDVSTLPYDIIIDYITEGLHHFHYFIVMRYNYFAQNGITSTILQRLLRIMFGQEAGQVYEHLLAGTDNVTLDINRALGSLAEEARANPDVQSVFAEAPLSEMAERLKTIAGGPEFLVKFDDFLNNYGERETNMGLGGIASPTWQDSPEVVLGIIKGMLNEKPNALKAREEARKVRARAAEERVYERLSQGIFSLLPLKRLFPGLLRHVRSFTAFRENSHYDVTRSLHVFRILITELGKRFERQGYLLDASGIFYLSYFEVRDIINTIFHGLEDVDVKTVDAKIRARRAEQERRLIRWKQRSVEFDETGAIRGEAASQGTTSGPVRIINEPGDFHRIRKGDILVAPYTNPAWTPLFAVAAGLVVETGGAASHAAIIAREYGIPAVMGVVKATELLGDGETVTINGSSGMIYRGDQTSEG